MPEGEKIGGGYVDITANLSPFDAAMAELPKKAAAKMDAAMKSLQARMAQTKLDLKVAYNAGYLAAQQKLQPVLENLKGKIASVEAATIKQATASRAEASAARAAAAEKIAAKAAERAAIMQTAQAQRVAAAQAKADAREQAVLAQRAAATAAPTKGMSGAMGLMMMSQFIDDMQYGFRAVVNQIPQLGMGLGAALGMSSDAAMKLGGAMGIAGVAINLVLNHAGGWAESMGLVAEETKKSADAIEALTERLKVLEAKPIKLAIDTFEIDQAKKKLAELEAAAQAFKGMGETASAGEKASGEAVSQKFAGLGRAEGDKIQTDLKAKMVQEITAQSETIKEVDREVIRAQEVQRKAETRLQFAGSMGGQRQALEDIDAAKARVKAAQDAAGKARLAISDEGGEAEREVGKIWSEATKGNVDAQKKLVARLQAIGQEKLASEIAGVRPDLMGPTEEDPDIARTNAFNERMAKEAKEKREAEDSRLAGAMQGSVGKGLLEDAGISDETLESRIKKAMEDAGVGAEEIAAAVKGTAKKLREKMDAAVQERAVSRGINENVARDQLFKEANERDGKRAGNQPKAEVMSTESYLNKVLVAGLNKEKDNRLPQEQLTEAKTSNKVLKEIHAELKKGQKPGPAMVAPGRA